MVIKVAYVVVPPRDEVEVVVVHEVGSVEDSQRSGRDTSAHRRACDRRVAHGVQHLGKRKDETKTVTADVVRGFVE